jgi:hypothetical protein
MRGAAGLRAIGAVTLGLEVMVIFFAVIAVYGLGHTLPAVSGGLLLGLAALLMLAPLALRWSWGPYAALATQGLVIAGGAIVAPLYVLGGLFAALWIGYLRMASRLLTVDEGALGSPSAEAPAQSGNGQDGQMTGQPGGQRFGDQ